MYALTEQGVSCPPTKHHQQTPKVEQECLVIAQAHTIIDPWAMVVKPSYTLVTCSTVLRAEGSSNLEKRGRGGDKWKTIISSILPGKLHRKRSQYKGLSHKAPETTAKMEKMGKLTIKNCYAAALTLCASWMLVFRGIKPGSLLEVL